MTLPELDSPHDPRDYAATTERPSKTQLKKAMHELQDLGEALVVMPEARVAALALPESLESALQEFRRTRSHEGRRRQMQYIGKLMRRIDPEPIRQAVAAMRLGQAKDALTLHQAESWRTRMIENDDAMTGWAAAFPASDLQQLRSLIRAARKDAAIAPELRSGRAYRELFQFIKQAQHGEEI
jgi:ribosome-associated protein